MNGQILLIGIPICIAIWLVWLVWFQDAPKPKRKWDEVEYTEKPKRIGKPKHVEEVVQKIYETRTSSSIWGSGGTSRWGGDLTKSELLEWEYSENLPTEPKPAENLPSSTGLVK